MFMDKCFPNFKKQVKILNDTILVVVKQNLSAKICLLDSCILSWNFEKSTEIKRTIIIQ